jgi:hypothetical protein
MDQDLKPIYKKTLIKGFDKCDKTIKDQVHRMNEFAIFTSPGLKNEKTKTEKIKMKLALDLGD